MSRLKCDPFYFILWIYLSGRSGSYACNHGPFPAEIKEDQSKAFREGREGGTGGGGSLRGDKMGVFDFKHS